MKQTKPMPECNCKAFSTCFEFQHDNRKIIPIRDKRHKTEYRYINKSANHLAKYRVDGGLISSGKKCDFLLLNCEQKQSYFIELKGSDMSQAIDQIDRSIDLLRHNLTGFAFFARIVLTKSPPTRVKNTKQVKLEDKLKSLNGGLISRTRLFEEVI
ncbi:hypothetical protein [Dysgonomonas reticulitermitis]